MITKHVLKLLIGIREVKVASNGRLYTFRGWTRHNKIDFQPCLVKKMSRSGDIVWIFSVLYQPVTT